MLTHLVVDLLIAGIDLGTNPRVAELAHQLFGVFVSFRDDSGHYDLGRRKPHWHLAGVVFNQDTDEPLERTQDRAMQHDGILAAAILGYISGPETLGQDVVEL